MPAACPSIVWNWRSILGDPHHHEFFKVFSRQLGNRHKQHRRHHTRWTTPTACAGGHRGVRAGQSSGADEGPPGESQSAGQATGATTTKRLRGTACTRPGAVRQRSCWPPLRHTRYGAPLAVSINPSISSLKSRRIRPETEPSNQALRVLFNIRLSRRHSVEFTRERRLHHSSDVQTTREGHVEGQSSRTGRVG
jgi:hypothetical protein